MRHPRRFSLGLLALLLAGSSLPVSAQQSVARAWNEVLLEAIRNDFARPTVHARNLFHTSVALYDAWALFDEQSAPYLLGSTRHGFQCPFDGIAVPADRKAAQEEMMSYAAYRLLYHRFFFSPGAFESEARFDGLFASLGYDPELETTDYSTGSPAAAGNYLARCLIDYGLQDGSNEQGFYENQSYQPVNPPLVLDGPGNPDIVDVNRWQPLTLEEFIDQAGNPIPFNTPEFLSPEWGRVAPFALSDGDRAFYERDGFDYPVYHDPGPPPQLDIKNGDGSSEAYRWGFALVAAWSSHLDPSDGVVIDISPGAQGNLDAETFPRSFDALPDFYDLPDGGDGSSGRAVNPRTGQPYAPNPVLRGDYARVLAEFWADGPDSETPPGHWFTILNYVMDHPAFEPRLQGNGEPVDPLEWDVKAYLTLGGAMHDSAVSAWGIKGWYDYVRPISAIRAMAEMGQSTDETLPNFSPGGLPLIEDLIELVAPDDSLAGDMGQHVGKVKLYAWRGHEFIEDPEVDKAGVGWVLAEGWWPYQRPSFVTPPFAGYVSGHSTYSRAAAEVLTWLTGDPYFPGGLGEFHAPRNEFLVFEEGPSADLTLQWATYRDASDQTSLSRIWGGIHPPADDIPGRLIGEQIGLDAVALADRYFRGEVSTRMEAAPERPVLAGSVYPNPVRAGGPLRLEVERATDVRLVDVLGREVRAIRTDGPVLIDTQGLAAGLYVVHARSGIRTWSQAVAVVR